MDVMKTGIFNIEQRVSGLKKCSLKLDGANILFENVPLIEIEGYKNERVPIVQSGHPKYTIERPTLAYIRYFTFLLEDIGIQKGRIDYTLMESVCELSPTIVVEKLQEIIIP